MCGITAKVSPGGNEQQILSQQPQPPFEALARQPVIRPTACRVIRSNYTETSALTGAASSTAATAAAAVFLVRRRCVLPGYETRLRTRRLIEVSACKAAEMHAPTPPKKKSESSMFVYS